MGGSVYEDRPSSFKTALKHGDEYISRQKDSAYVSLLSTSEQQSYREAARLRDLMRSCAGLYKGWQDAQQTGVISLSSGRRHLAAASRSPAGAGFAGLPHDDIWQSLYAFPRKARY
jgi:hypothetical protein